MILNGKKKKGGTETFANERMGIYIGVCVRQREREIGNWVKMALFCCFGLVGF